MPAQLKSGVLGSFAVFFSAQVLRFAAQQDEDRAGRKTLVGSHKRVQDRAVKGLTMQQITHHGGATGDL